MVLASAPRYHAPTPISMPTIIAVHTFRYLGNCSLSIYTINTLDNKVSHHIDNQHIRYVKSISDFIKNFFHNFIYLRPFYQNELICFTSSARSKQTMFGRSSSLSLLRSHKPSLSNEMCDTHYLS